MGELGGRVVVRVFKTQIFGYRVPFVHLWKKIQGEVKTMFDHKEFGGHF
jgi:hypothetical protein